MKRKDKKTNKEFQLRLKPDDPFSELGK